MSEKNNLQGQEGAGEGAGSQENFEELTQEQLAAQFNAAAEGNREGEGGNGEDGAGTGGEGGEGGEGGDPEFKSPLSEDETAVYAEILGAEIPEGVYKNDKGETLEKKEVLQRITNMIEKKSQSKLMNDPFISRYVAEKSKDGFNEADFIKGLTQTTNVMEMDNREFIKHYLKGKNYTDEDITEFFESKNKVDVDELAIAKKKELVQQQEQENTEAYQKFIQRRTQEMDVFNKKVNVLVDDYVENQIKSGKHPLKLAESDMEKVVQKMHELTTMQLIEVDGRQYEATPLDNRLKSNGFLLKVLPYIALEDLGMLDDNMRNTLNRVKNKEFEKIDGTNALGKGGDPTGGTNWAKFMGNS